MKLFSITKFCKITNIKPVILHSYWDWVIERFFQRPKVYLLFNQNLLDQSSSFVLLIVSNIINFNWKWLSIYCSDFKNLVIQLCHPLNIFKCHRISIIKSMHGFFENIDYNLGLFLILNFFNDHNFRSLLSFPVFI